MQWFEASTMLFREVVQRGLPGWWKLKRSVMSTFHFTTEIRNLTTMMRRCAAVLVSEQLMPLEIWCVCAWGLQKFVSRDSARRCDDDTVICMALQLAVIKCEIVKVYVPVISGFVLTYKKFCGCEKYMFHNWQATKDWIPGKNIMAQGPCKKWYVLRNPERGTMVHSHVVLS